MSASIVWLRNDLRLHDQPAFAAACKLPQPLIAIFIWAPEEEATWSPGAASRFYLHQSLNSLAEELRDVGSRLILRKTNPQKQIDSLALLQDIIRTTNATHVFWNRRYEPAVIKRDLRIKETLKAQGLHTESFNGSLLMEPWQLATGSGGPYKVFTPFAKNLAKNLRWEELPALPKSLPAPNVWPSSLSLAELQLEPTIKWAEKMRTFLRAGTASAHKKLARFADIIVDYGTNRDIPGISGTSLLSPHLHFGEISPRQIYTELQRLLLTKKEKKLQAGVDKYLNELYWRDFAYHLLYHFPETPEQPLRKEFAKFAWKNDTAHLQRWQKGETGYPLVDAGMRQLWATGWMHNRVRMVVASFLVKDLLIDWQQGARWFWETLADADLASNTLGWQWSAGCGADAAPFFRIFNPVSQGERFDADAAYIREWLPELSKLSNKYIQEPWKAPAVELQGAGIVLGKNYPLPIVDHAAARNEALQRFEQLK